MPKDVRGGRLVPDHRRLMRADAPHLRQPIPALGTPVENANAVADKAAATLARAGSGLDNPILAGLGMRVQISLAPGDVLQGVWIFRDHGDVGGNLISQVSVAGQIATLDLQVGMGGITVPGTAATGAKKHFIRWKTRGGAVEKEFYLKGYDHDVVTLNGEAALDEALQPVEVVVSIVDASRDWLDVPIDFFTSWIDEFHVLHRRTDDDVEAGFAKAYGGVHVVSFFDTSTDTEGVGVQVNPVTQAVIRSRRTIQVENTEGLKEITVRFRSATDSTFVVDVPILIRVVEPDTENCLVPQVQPCVDLYIKNGQAIPEGLPGEASDPDEDPEEAEEGAVAAGDLLYITVRAASVGSSPKLRVKRWAWVASAPALAGARLIQVDSAVDYIPFSQSATTPDPGGSYGDPKRLTVALSVAALNADNVAFLTVAVLDDNDLSEEVLIAGPKARAIQFMPIGGTGGGATCAAY
jgi:hypothetical protein